MEIQNTSTASSISNQPQNVNITGWESMNITTQQEEIYDRKSEVITFVVNADMDVNVNNLYIQIQERSFWLKHLL